MKFLTTALTLSVLFAVLSIKPLYGWFLLFAAADFASCWQMPDSFLKLLYGQSEP